MAHPLQHCCLVAEDQALIGMAIEAYLEEAGIEVAGPFSSCAEALSWAEGRTPELAILDFKLQDGPCTELAKTLLGRNVPIIIYSGLRRGAHTPRELDRVTWLEKPIDRAALMTEAARVAPALAGNAPARAAFAAPSATPPTKPPEVGTLIR